MNSNQELFKGFFFLQIIWIALLAALAIYLFIGLVIIPNTQISLNANSFSVFRICIYVISFTTLILTRIIKRIYLSAKREPQQTIQAFQHPILKKYATAMIVTWSMSESLGVYGLLLFYLGRNTFDLYTLILISACAMIIYRPKKDEIINLHQDSLKASTNAGALQ